MDLKVLQARIQSVAAALGPASTVGLQLRTRVLTWMINDFIAHALRFAAKAQADAAAKGMSQADVQRVLSEIADAHQHEADVAKAAIGAAVGPS
jgi:hypothetical protein